MKKRKKLIITLSIIFVILLFTGGGIYIWYLNSPFPTLVKLVSSVKEKDTDAILECIEPKTAQKIQLLIDFTGISIEDAIDKIMPSDTESSELDGSSNNTSIKFADYNRDDNNAYIELAVKNETENTERSVKINFVRIDGTWYLSLFD